jgi:hypothetical protein
MVLVMLAGIMASCASTKNPYRPLTSAEKSAFTVLGSIQATFTAFNGSAPAVINEPVKQQAYIRLMEEVLKKYQGNVDVRNIIVVYIKGHYMDVEYMATGDVVISASEKIIANTILTGIEGSLARAAGQIMSSIQPSSNIAIVYVTSYDMDTTEYIANELEFIMVNKGFTIVDRSQLDKIRQEQDLQLSGEVDDDTAVGIGKIAGANIIITGSVTGTDSTKRLRLRALSTQTAQVLAVASERL